MRLEMSDSVRRLSLSESDKKIAGVCGGLAEYMNIDSTVMRLIFLVLFFFGGGGFLLYVICWAIIPRLDISR